MIKANVIISHDQWKKKIKNPTNYFKNKLKKILEIPYFRTKKHEFSILLTNNKEMKNLNYKFREKNKPTDVLSFPLKNKNYIGDIAISFEIINKRSKKTNFFLELDKMWIHGYFHLIGYDHRKIDDYKKMLNKENTVLKHFHKLN